MYKKAHNPHSTQRCPNGTCFPFRHCREKEDAQILADRASFFLSCPVPLTSSTWAARTTSRRKMLRFSRTVVAFYAGFTAIDRPVQAKRYNGLVVACRGAWRWNGWQTTKPSRSVTRWRGTVGPGFRRWAVTHHFLKDITVRLNSVGFGGEYGLMGLNNTMPRNKAFIVRREDFDL